MPPALSSAGADAIDLARRAGLVLDPWEQWVLDAFLGERPDGGWVCSECVLLCTRQNGKGVILEARELAGLFLFGEEHLLHTAHRQKAYRTAFKRMIKRIEANPWLRRQCHWPPREANGQEAIELKSGATLSYGTRSSLAGRSQSLDLVVFDEAMDLSESSLSDLLMTQAARLNAQRWLVGSAGGDPKMDSTVLRRYRERGMKGGSPRLGFAEWSTEDDADLDDPEQWAIANPGLGYRITIETIETEREALTDEQFGRERLGIWGGVSGGAVIGEKAWAALRDDDARAVGDRAFAVAVSPDRDRAAIGVAATTAESRHLLEMMDPFDGHDGAQKLMDAVSDRLIELARRWDCPVALDPSSPAGGLIPTLAAAGVEVTLITGRKLGQACGYLVDEVAGERVAHIGQGPLTAAVAAGRKLRSGKSWVWQRQSDADDITPLEAVTFALFAHAELLVPQTEKPKSPPLVVAAHSPSAPSRPRW